MARKRMIDPNIWQSEDFNKLSLLARLVFIGMFSNADDEGRGRSKAVYLKSIIFPYDEAIRIADVDKTLSEISSNMSVIFYSHDENTYYQLINWANWQRVDKPQTSKIPVFDEHNESFRRLFDDCSTIVRRLVPPSIVKYSIDKISIDKISIEEKIKVYFENEELNNIFNEYLNLRKKLKYNISDTVVKRLTNTLNKYTDDTIKIIMIEKAITGSWKDLYELKKSEIKGKTNNLVECNGEMVTPAMKIFLEREEEIDDDKE